jgi:hypothetical protein
VIESIDAAVGGWSYVSHHLFLGIVREIRHLLTGAPHFDIWTNDGLVRLLKRYLKLNSKDAPFSSEVDSATTSWRLGWLYVECLKNPRYVSDLAKSQEEERRYKRLQEDVAQKRKASMQSPEGKLFQRYSAEWENMRCVECAGGGFIWTPDVGNQECNSCHGRGFGDRYSLSPEEIRIATNFQLPEIPPDRWFGAHEKLEVFVRLAKHTDEQIVQKKGVILR